MTGTPVARASPRSSLAAAMTRLASSGFAAIVATLGSRWPRCISIATITVSRGLSTSPSRSFSIMVERSTISTVAMIASQPSTAPKPKRHIVPHGSGTDNLFRGTPTGQPTHVRLCPERADGLRRWERALTPVSLVALPGRVSSPARSRTRAEAIAFVLTHLHLPTVKSASRHKRQWITQVPQPHPVSKLVRPQDAGKRIRRMSNDNYRSTPRTRWPCASVETISHVGPAEPNLLDNLNVGIHAMDSVALRLGLYDFWRIGRSEGADWTIPFECHVA